jgi:ABC-type amino acid transport substrate-binding protein
MTAVWGIVELRKDPELHVGLMIGPPTSVGFAVRKDEPRLLAALNDYVTNVRRTPTWSRLVVKYFGESGLEILRKSRE